MTSIIITPNKNGVIPVQQLFDFFMQQREPDLVSTVVDNIAEKYTDESLE